MSGHTGDLDSAISKTQEKLRKEKNILNKTRELLSQLTNPNAKANAETMCMDAERRVSYLQAELDRLLQKKENRNSIHSPGDAMHEGDSHQTTLASSSTKSSTKSSSGRPHSLSLSKLDLRKTSSDLSMQKISLKVHEIAYKLEVERKIRDNANRIRSLYSDDYRRGSKGKITQIIDSEKMFREAEDRIRLLEYSLKMYQSLYVDYVDDDDETLNDESPGGYQPAIRRPMTGKLQLRVNRAMYLRRAPIRTTELRSAQHFVVIKVDGKVRGTTPIARDSIFNHYFEVDVHKASEVELSIFERGDQDYLVGLMWVRLSDIYEDIRKQEMLATSADGWATAEQVARGVQQPGGSSRANSGSTPGTPLSAHHQHPSTPLTPAPPGGGSGPGVLSNWDVESQGQIELWVNFVKEVQKRRQQSRLGRKAAVRKRRGPCTEMCGHHFYPLHTYTIMKCAVCGEHIVNDVGQQCDDCQLFVHQKCIQRVVMHCLSGPVTSEEDPTEIIKHRIPHRWEQSTNIGANWCCHCGMMLTIGRRALKCSECSMTCHSACKACVPHFCGLDMIRASAMVQEVRRAKGSAVPQPKLVTKRDTVARKPAAPGTNAIPPVDPQVANLQDRMQQMQLPSLNISPQQTTGYPRQTSSMSPISPAPPQLGPSAPTHQRENSSEFIPLKSGNLSPIKVPVQVQPQSQQRPPMSGGQQVGGSHQPSGVQPPSYYQQQIQQSRQHHQFQSPAQQSQQPQRYQQPMQSPAQQHQQLAHGQRYTPPRVQSADTMGAQPTRPAIYDQQQQTYQMSQQRLENIASQQQTRQSLYATGGGTGAVPGQFPPHSAGPNAPVAAPRPDISNSARQQIIQSMQQPAQQKQQQPLANQPPRKAGIDDFRFLKVLGKGNFGKVMLSEEKATSKLYAIKVLKKGFIVEHEEFESTRSEKRVLLIANRERHPFLIGLHSCFQTNNHLFFAMEYISGGDLMMHVQKLGAFGERRAKFFACEILLGLAYFHKAGIIYRDLKLDNIMLDSEGHVKIADYGLCKENMGYGQTTITFCGTPEFMAPEIVLEQRYGRAVDWWAFGVLIYEMILGTSPFHGEDEEEIFESILEDEILYPVKMSRDAVFICQALLEKEPSKRLGSGPNDAEDIKAHSFFAGTNWDDVLNKRITPLYVPEIRGRFDVSNFDPEFTSERPVLTPTNTINREDQVEFSDFDYVSPWAGKAEKWTR
ncbi:Serine/threonine kinase [Dipsacomyces acuminosporus]|nr:Serine/threonine kinase [Dipsacomyces acuminosporus]